MLKKSAGFVLVSLGGPFEHPEDIPTPAEFVHHAETSYLPYIHLCIATRHSSMILRLALVPTLSAPASSIASVVFQSRMPPDAFTLTRPATVSFNNRTSSTVAPAAPK